MDTCVSVSRIVFIIYQSWCAPPQTHTHRVVLLHTHLNLTSVCLRACCLFVSTCVCWVLLWRQFCRSGPQSTWPMFYFCPRQLRHGMWLEKMSSCLSSWGAAPHSAPLNRLFLFWSDLRTKDPSLLYGGLGAYECNHLCVDCSQSCRDLTELMWGLRCPTDADESNCSFCDRSISINVKKNKNKTFYSFQNSTPDWDIKSFHVCDPQEHSVLVYMC